ncbi:MAG: hypothetical protein FWF81_00365 [Defluviitaleaceae bacterium]|nr:hypothetical protein [Defluviitaleaceae bacterium]
MSRKKILTVVSALVISLILAIPLFAIEENISYGAEPDCVETQLERLHELMNFTINQFDSFEYAPPFSSYSDSVEVSLINFISPPNDVHDYFSIGLNTGLDCEQITFENLDMLTEITMREPSQDVVDFILTFAGIPAGRAEISYSIILPILPLSYEEPLPEICPVWGDVTQNNNARNIPHSTPRMGNRVRLTSPNNVFVGTATVGHPLGADRPGNLSFVSAFHRGNIVNYHAFDALLPTFRMGTVTRSQANVLGDFTVINLAWSNGIASDFLPPPFPSGSRIGNFRGTPRINDTVRSIRGFSGVQEARIIDASATVGDWRNTIVVSPAGIWQQGDSGAALIRTNDRAVVGTLRAARISNGVQTMIYTPVTVYS